MLASAQFRRDERRSNELERAKQGTPSREGGIGGIGPRPRWNRLGGLAVSGTRAGCPVVGLKSGARRRAMGAWFVRPFPGDLRLALGLLRAFLGHG